MTATWDPSAGYKPMTRAGEKIYSGKDYSYYYVANYGYLPLGSYGWTNVTNGSDGSYKYHYTVAECYSGSNTWTSSRVWGSGKVYAYTGRVANWSISGCRVYYGW